MNSSRGKQLLLLGERKEEMLPPIRVKEEEGKRGGGKTDVRWRFSPPPRQNVRPLTNEDKKKKAGCRRAHALSGERKLFGAGFELSSMFPREEKRNRPGPRP